ncbi:hypothetical protein GOODEAATRI_022700 [Goodea atripinnis]|uniref:Uncharacterized protein n=1 Tax=Goodea atripinnis TaxID=208336 RepID=A0ABV0Q0A6_9TELE
MVDVSHVTTRRPSRNFPGVAPPAPQIQIVCLNKSIKKDANAVLFFPFCNNTCSQLSSVHPKETRQFVGVRVVLEDGRITWH